MPLICQGEWQPNLFLYALFTVVTSGAAPTCAGAACLRVAAPLPLGLATTRDYRITIRVLLFWYRKALLVNPLRYILSSLFLNF